MGPYLPIIPYTIFFIIAITVLYFLVIRPYIRNIFKYSRFPYISLGLWIILCISFIINPDWILNWSLCEFLCTSYNSYLSIDYFRVWVWYSYSLLNYVPLFTTIWLIVTWIISSFLQKDNRSFIILYHIVYPICLYLMTILYMLFIFSH